MANSLYRYRAQSESIRLLHLNRSVPVAEALITSIKSVFIGSIRYFKKYGGRYIKKRDMNPHMQQNDRGASMQRKQIRREELAALPSKSLGRERSVSRSREPSQESRGNSSARTDAFAYIPAHQRDRRIGESNSDSHRKEIYDRRRESESSHDRGHDNAKDRDRHKNYGKDRERDQHSETGRDKRSSGRDPTPDRHSHSREKVDDHKKRTGDARDKKDSQDPKEKRRNFSPHPARDRSSNYECTQVADDYTSVCAFLNAASAANEADRAEDRLLSASIPHPSHNPRIPSLLVDVLPDTGAAWSADYINEATAAWLRSVGIKRKKCSVLVVVEWN